MNPSEIGMSALGLLLCLVLVMVNAYFVASEFALVAVRKSQVKLWVKEGRLGAKSVLHAIENLDDAIAATQLGITLASIALGWVGEHSLAALLRPIFSSLGFENAILLHSGATILAFSLITFMHVVAGELAPKALALDRPGEVALLATGPLLTFGKIFHPILFLMNGAGNRLVRLLGAEPSSEISHVHSPEELSMMVSESSDAGMIRDYTSRILGNVFRTSRIRVKDVMIPRDGIFAVEEKIGNEDLLDRIREECYTRIPVFRGSLDQVVGILHTKDLFHIYSKDRIVILHDAIRPVTVMSPKLPIVDALRQFRNGRSHMAIVRDTEGPVQGIVTLEDILEELVGEIEDEHDEPTPEGIA